MTREYEQVREDLKRYLADNSIPQYEFAKEAKMSASELSRFLSGNKFGEARKRHWIGIISPIIYTNDSKEKVQEEPVVEEGSVETLDGTITKLIDRKIEETMKQIAELETKVKNLEASRDILRELLD